MPVTMVMGMTADGKIGRVTREAVNLGAADRRRLEEHCAAADVIIMGAGALRSYGTTPSIRQAELLARRRAEGRPPQPTTCIVSRQADLDLGLPFFTRQQVPRLLAVPDEAGAAARTRFDSLADIWTCGAGSVDLAELHRRLAERFEQIALLGGGALNAGWLAGAPLDRLELTVAPCLFGGATAPTVIDGEGLAEPLALRLERCEQEDGLLFLSYQVSR